ncbi:molecular chaperone [Paracoccus sp. SCSIO 75233]|uniref:TorD/DmsD family molecular chaperone n=1 Tax=Paracoccus sp. SCSIO 75233 TaxID=3017782 RepID=UPI0022F04CAC|nr:molecular chaperone TorD family protein [Paracoccus sp. SCSIO 75233]WBU54208.1 molecular chaperone TorD family protein [Paracoccus sp. SCSIO 75233]
MDDQSGTPDQEAVEALGVGAQALGLLIRLLDREPDAELLSALKEMRAGDFYAELLPVGRGHEAGLALQSALDSLPDAPDQQVLDLLAADFADCFLTHGYRLSPNGSVWMMEERLERQLPMFEVREWYAHYGLEVPDWRIRSDDHLVHQLQFVQHLMELSEQVALVDAAHFMDRHVLPWAPEMGRRMAQRCATPLYAATGALVADLLPVLRELLAELTGVAISIAPLPGDKPHPKAPERELYIPGAAPSW